MRGRSLLLGALLLTACGTGSDTPTGSKDALRFSTSNLPVAYVGESFSADLQVGGGVSPYQLRLSDGTLPDGLALNGTTLSGMPKTAGAFSFTLEASDASLSTRVQRYSLTVASQVSFELRPTLPVSGVVGESRIPLVVNHPKGATAARFQWRLPAGTRVTGVQPGDTQPVVFWKQSGNLFTLDLGFRRSPPSGSQVAMLSLKPDKPVRLDASNAPISYRGLDAGGKEVGKQDFPTVPTGASSTVGNSTTNSTTGTSSGGGSTGGASAGGTSSTGTSGSSTTGSSTSGTSGQGTSSIGTSSTGTSATSTDGASSNGSSSSGASLNGTSSNGSSANGASTGGTSGTGTSTPGTSTPGTSTSGGSQ